MMWGLRSSRTVVVGIAAGAFLVFCLSPLIYVAIVAVPALDTAVLLDSRQRGLLYNTVLLGLGTTVLATIVGAPLGFALARIPMRWTMAVRLTLLVPAVLPPYVVALAWSYVDSDFHSLGGAIVVMASVFYPLSMLATEAGLRRVEPRLEEAALLSARPMRVLWRITAPLVARNVLAAALVILALAISEFSVPGLLRVRVFATEVFTAFAALYDVARATALATPLLLVSASVAGVAAALGEGRMVARQRGLGGTAPIAFESWRPAALTAVAGVVLVATITPIASLVSDARQTSIADAVRGSREAARNSLLLAAIGATLVTTLACWLGYWRARMSGPSGVALDVVWVVVFALPASIIGIGLIGLWNRPGVSGAIYGTAAMLIVGYLARFLPVAALIMAAIIQQVPTSHEEAAAASGSGWLRTMHRIVLPQIRTGLAAVWILSFILAFGEVGASILLAPAGESTLPIRVYTLTANAPPGHIAALALFQSVVVLCPLLLLGAAVAARNGR